MQIKYLYERLYIGGMVTLTSIVFRLLWVFATRRVVLSASEMFCNQLHKAFFSTEFFTNTTCSTSEAELFENACAHDLEDIVAKLEAPPNTPEATNPGKDQKSRLLTGRRQARVFSRSQRGFPASRQQIYRRGWDRRAIVMPIAAHNERTDL